MPGFEIFGAEEKQQVLEVLDSGVLFRYEFAAQRNGVWKVLEFEKAFAAYTGATYAQAVTSGTAALKVALTALGVGAGDEAGDDADAHGAFSSGFRAWLARRRG